MCAMRQNKRFFIVFVILVTAVFSSILWQANKTAAGTLEPRAYLPLIISPPGDVPFGTVHSGIGTYYFEAHETGNCLFPPTPTTEMVAAMNETDYNNAALCGAYVQATGPKGTVVVRIVDRCPGCGPGHVDFSTEAFAAIADIPQGRVDITWRLVSPAISSPIQYHFKDGSNQWWTAVQIRNHRNPITKFEYWSGSSWISVPRYEWNHFVKENGMGPGPYTFRVTDYFGNTIVDSGIPLLDDGTVTGTNQLPPPP